MIRIITEQGEYEVEGTAKDVHTDKYLTITRNNRTIATFKRWLHWLETTECETTKRADNPHPEKVAVNKPNLRSTNK